MGLANIWARNIAPNIEYPMCLFLCMHGNDQRAGNTSLMKTSNTPIIATDVMLTKMYLAVVEPLPNNSLFMIEFGINQAKDDINRACNNIDSRATK